MRPTIFVIYEDIKTLLDTFSIKALIVSVFIISMFPYLVLSRFDAFGSQISNSVAVLVMVLQLSVPYIAMRMSYSSVSGEIDRNNHRLLLTFPMSRLNLVVGKWISRSIATAVAVTMYTLISLMTSSLLYKSMSVGEILWIIFVSSIIGAIFCSIGVAVSCVTNPNSIVPDLLIAAFYVPLVFFWRLVPFILELLSEGGEILPLPSAGYDGWQYFILRVNPMETYSSLLSSGINSDINIFIPSTLRLPDVSNAKIIDYSSTPVDPGSVPIYAQELVTIPISVLIPVGFLAYGYWKIRKRDL
jgi:ABC-type transport system involved in multi-copper enzyme maturation permease subunit